MPRSNRRCCPGWGGDWFGGNSSTRIATFFFPVRNSCGSGSNAASSTLTKCSRFILHPLKYARAGSLRVAFVVIIVIIVIFFAVAFVFLVWLLSKDDIGGWPAMTRVGAWALWEYF